MMRMSFWIIIVLLYMMTKNSEGFRDNVTKSLEISEMEQGNSLKSLIITTIKHERVKKFLELSTVKHEKRSKSLDITSLEYQSEILMKVLIHETSFHECRCVHFIGKSWEKNFVDLSKVLMGIFYSVRSIDLSEYNGIRWGDCSCYVNIVQNYFDLEQVRLELY